MGLPEKKEIRKPHKLSSFKKTIVWNPKLTTVFPSVSMFYSQTMLSPHILSPHDRGDVSGSWKNASDGAPIFQA